MSLKTSKIPNRKNLEQKYESKRETYEKILFELMQNIREKIESTSLNPAIKTRVKSFDSYYNKLLKKLRDTDDTVKTVQINDKLGLRIICPFQENLKVMESFIRENYDLIEYENKGIGNSFKEFGYSSLHFVIELPEKTIKKYDVTDDLKCEVQVCTALQDAWAEVEHSLFYKTEFSPFDEVLKRKLAALNANLTLSDILFQEILDYKKKLKKQLKKRREAFFDKVEEEAAGFDYDLLVLESPKTPDHGNNDDSKTERLPYDNIKHNFDNLLLDALEAHNNNNYTEAISIYSDVLEHDIPDIIKVIVYLHRGMARFAESDYDNAVSDFSYALKIDRNNYKALYYRGMVNKVKQNFEAAIEDFHLCIQINPYKFYPYFNRAQIFYEIKKYVDALKDCEFALQIEPDSIKAKELRETIKSVL